jgi:pyrimidine-nucleoside phosphorylase
MTPVADPLRYVASSRVIRAVERKRAGYALEQVEIDEIVSDFVASRVPDYQIAAFLATVACTGMSLDEIVALTLAYATGGSEVGIDCGDRFVVDKHSTGGVGDKTTLVVVPLVAACGVPVAKISGRGLGFAGGTIDKLESIAGLKLDLTMSEASRILKSCGMVITGQSDTLAPGDAATYAIRDVTGTVDSIPLIAASILSKKVALGVNAIVLDVKVGSGALTPDLADASDLASVMTRIARKCGIGATAVLSDMSQPLGHAVGNALEVREALDVLSGRRIPGLSELCDHLAEAMLQIADPKLTQVEAQNRIRRVIENGSALEMLLRWAREQGATEQSLNDRSQVAQARTQTMIRADRSGWVRTIYPRSIGMASLHLGAGRLRQDDKIDPNAGIVLQRRVGDWVDAGDILAVLHGDFSDHSGPAEQATRAFLIGDEQPAPIDLIKRAPADIATRCAI